MKKRTYRAKKINEVDATVVSCAVEGKQVVFAVDVAKEQCFGRLVTREATVAATVKWDQLSETREMVAWLRDATGRAAQVDVAMEASGTYADALRYQFERAELPVYRVSGKRCHDAGEVFDGVPSMHDGKAADIIAHLHLHGLSSRWKEDRLRRELAAPAQLLATHQQGYLQALNRIEALLGRHWPELTQALNLATVTLLAVLEEFGGPAGVRAQPLQARWLMHKVGGSLLRPEKIERVIASSQSTIGVPMLVGEQELLRHLAAEARRHYKLAREAEQELARCSKGHTPTEGMGAVVGVTTAAVLTSCLGDPRDYPAAAAYVKAAGLNLKEQSSGKHLGQIKITKRGPSEARRLLYLATLRLIQEHGDPILREWYERKVRREGGKRKKKAVVALMRKLLGALWHVAAGERFDSQRLFDTRSLLVSRVLRS